MDTFLTEPLFVEEAESMHDRMVQLAECSKRMYAFADALNSQSVDCLPVEDRIARLEELVEVLARLTEAAKQVASTSLSLGQSTSSTLEVVKALMNQSSASRNIIQ